jgi:hypothetical protein
MVVFVHFIGKGEFRVEFVSGAVDEYDQAVA